MSTDFSVNPSGSQESGVPPTSKSPLISYECDICQANVTANSDKVRGDILACEDCYDVMLALRDGRGVARLDLSDDDVDDYQQPDDYIDVDALLARLRDLHLITCSTSGGHNQVYYQLGQLEVLLRYLVGDIERGDLYV